MSDLTHIEKSLEAFKQLKPLTKDETVAKGFTQPDDPVLGLQDYDVLAPALLFQPENTPFINKLTAEVDGKGTHYNFKVFIDSEAQDEFGGVGEGQRGAEVDQTLIDSSAKFKAFGLENSYTEESQLAANGFDDVAGRAAQFMVHQAKLSQEKSVLFGRSEKAPRFPRTPTPTVSIGTGGTIAAGSYSLIAVALTGKGMLRASVKKGVRVAGFIVSANGTQIVTDGFNGAPSVAVPAVVAADGGSISGVVERRAEVFGYAWYLGVAGQERLAAITTHNSVVLTALADDTAQLATALGTADHSRHSLDFDGIFAYVAKTAEIDGVDQMLGKWKIMPTGTPGVGVGMTANAAGGIEEFDEMLQEFWDEKQFSPQEIWVSSRELIAIRKLCASNPSGTGNMRWTANMVNGVITGGSIIATYYNPFALEADVPELKIRLHPNLMPGTVLFWTDTVPYPTTNIGPLAKIKYRKGYNMRVWVQDDRTQKLGLYHDETLVHYHPGVMGVISNIGTGTGTGVEPPAAPVEEDGE